jgi:hypothetical protein
MYFGKRISPAEILSQRRCSQVLIVFRDATGRNVASNVSTERVYLRTSVVTKTVPPAGDKIKEMGFWPTNDLAVYEWMQD